MTSVEEWRDVLHWVPFVGLTIRKKADGSLIKHPLTIRLVEAAIIGGVVMYGTVMRTEMKLQALQEQVAHLRADAAEIRQQLRLAEQELWRRKGFDKLGMWIARVP